MQTRIAGVITMARKLRIGGEQPHARDRDRPSGQCFEKLPAMPSTTENLPAASFHQEPSNLAVFAIFRRGEERVLKWIGPIGGRVGALFQQETDDTKVCALANREVEGRRVIGTCNGPDRAAAWQEPLLQPGHRRGWLGAWSRYRHRSNPRASACQSRRGAIVSQLQAAAPEDSCLKQDEPETGNGFSHKMSLKGGGGMLGIDHQHGRYGSDEPGADPGVSGRKR